MASKQVIQVQCDRCERVETIDPNKEKKAASPMLAGAFAGEKFCFEDLCGPCHGAVSEHLKAITKKIKGLSPDRKKKDEVTVDVEEVPASMGAKKEGLKPSPPPR